MSNPDFLLSDHGTIFILTAHSSAAREWSDAHLPEDATRWGQHGVVIEHRCVEAIVQGAIDDGLTIGSL